MAIAKYKIKGTISVSVSLCTTALYLMPSQGFVSPDKKYGISYPCEANPEDKSAKLLILEGEKRMLPVDNELMSAQLPALISIAVTQKPVELILNEALKVVGFVFPAP